MDLKRLRYFCAIYEYGSVSGASQVLHVSQPALSKRLQELEEETGGPLFLRTTDGMVPTEAGGLLYRTAREVVFKVEEISQKLAMLSSGQKQLCHIGLSYLYCQYFSPLLLELQAARQDVEFNVTVSDSSHLEFLMKNGMLDISLQQKAETFPGAECLELPEVEAMVVAHRDLPVHGDAGTITMEALGRLPLLLIKRINGVGTYESILDALLCQGQTPNVVMRVSDCTTVLQYVATGICAATVVPRSEITDFHTRHCRILKLTNAPPLYRPVLYRKWQSPCANIFEQAKSILGV
jgi:DNA-binding transcriptional LysR family regulator